MIMSAKVSSPFLSDHCRWVSTLRCVRVATQRIRHFGGEADAATDHQTPALDRIVPQPRTLRKAREQVKQMVADGLSAQRIKRYLHRWTLWWVRTSDSWQYEELLEWFLRVCWDEGPAAFAVTLLQRITSPAVQCRAPGLSTSGFQATA